MSLMAVRVHNVILFNFFFSTPSRKTKTICYFWIKIYLPYRKRRLKISIVERKHVDHKSVVFAYGKYTSYRRLAGLKIEKFYLGKKRVMME